MIKHAILIDFGSTFTKIVLTDLREKKIVLTDQAPSTVHTDAGIALEQCFDSVRKVLSEEEFDQALKLSSSSAAGGLRMAVVGLTKNLSIAAGQAAVFGAGAKIMGVYYGMLSEESAKEIADMDLEIVLLCGGYEKGNQTMVLHNAQILAESGVHVPIVYSGNREAARGVQWLMKSHEKECFLVENILPNVGVLNVEPAQELIRHLFMERIVNMKGLEKVRGKLDGVLMPTPAAVLAAGELLSKGTAATPGLGELMITDIGGATTDIYSYNINQEYEGCKKVGIEEPYAKRTVEADLGMRESCICFEKELDVPALALRAGMTPEQFSQEIHRRAFEKSFIPSEEKEWKQEQILAEQDLKIAVRRHAGKLEYTGSSIQGVLQKGKNLTGIRTVIGTGGPVIRSQNPSAILHQVEKNGIKDDSVLLPERTETYIDRQYVLFAAGLLRDYDEEAALAIMKQSIERLE